MGGKTFGVALASDIHFPKHHRALWEGFKRWHKDVRPALTVLAGDVVDLGALSDFPPEEDENLDVAREMRMAAKEINSLEGPKTVLPGNHEKRFHRALKGKLAPQLRGMLGLTFSEQMHAQGLRKDNVTWVFESSRVHGLWLGKKSLLVRHGDNQFKFGPKHLAAAMLQKTPNASQVIGHCHRAQIMCRTSLGHTTVAVTNPTMQLPQEFAKDADWQHGFSYFEFWGGKRLQDCKYFTPYLVIAQRDGSFSYGGKVYGGKP